MVAVTTQLAAERLLRAAEELLEAALHSLELLVALAAGRTAQDVTALLGMMALARSAVEVGLPSVESGMETETKSEVAKK